MSLSLTFDLRDTASPRLQTFVNGMGDRTRLHAAIGEDVRNLVRDYMIMLAATKHDTAERLGAQPSGHWAQAVEKTTYAADGEAATITVEQVGIGRAEHDVDIVPGAGKKFLAIPLIAEAYNNRASALWDSEHLFIPKGHNVIASSDGEGKLTVWYALVSSVHQSQDRTLLPSDEELLIEAKAGVVDYIDMLLASKEAA